MSSNSREYHRKYYRKNRRKVRAYQRRYTERLRALVLELKGALCKVCHKTYPPVVLDFDHVRGTKSGNVSQWLRFGWGEQRIRAEIKKCDVVCANCHRVRTDRRMRRRRGRT